MNNKEKRPDCEWFMLKKNTWDTGSCQTDGHYMCANCKCIASFEDMELSDNRMRYYPEQEKEANLLEEAMSVVLSRHPNAGILTCQSDPASNPTEKTVYHIMRDGQMAFTDCEEDADFLTKVEDRHNTESDAWVATSNSIIDKENKKK